MQLEQPAADADTPPAIRRFGPLKCRPQAVYAKEQLLAGTRKHPEGAALSEFDVLKRARVRGPILRECTATGFFSFFSFIFFRESSWPHSPRVHGHWCSVFSVYSVRSVSLLYGYKSADTDAARLIRAGKRCARWRCAV